MPFATLRRLAADARGATALEYALLAALIAIALVTVLSGTGDETSTMYSNVESKVDNALS